MGNGSSYRTLDLVDYDRKPMTVDESHTGKIIRRTGPQARTGDRSYIGCNFFVVKVHPHGMDVRRISDKYDDSFSRKYPLGEPMFLSFQDRDYQDGRWEVAEEITGESTVDAAVRILFSRNITPEMYAKFFNNQK